MHRFWATPGHARSLAYKQKGRDESWSLETLKVTSKDEVLIPRENAQCHPLMFRLPVEFPPSLRTIVVEDTIFRVLDEPSGA